jgi:predicted nucleotidyltransferase
MVTVANLGQVTPVDSQGFVMRQAHITKIVEPWNTAVDAIKTLVTEYLGRHIHSLYIRGSVAVGKAIPGTSDIDVLAVLAVPTPEWDIGSAKRGLSERVGQAFPHGFGHDFPFVARVDLEMIPASRLLDMSSLEYRGARLMIKTHAVCVYGEDLAERLPQFKPGPDAFVHLLMMEADLADVRQGLPNLPAPRVVSDCAWIMKRMVRASYELVMEREQGYTRDLYPCYLGFAKYYPGRASEMRQVLELAINPTDDRATVRAVIDGIGGWLVEQRRNIETGVS